jgi:phosphatidylinositol phospholipase C, delta
MPNLITEIREELQKVRKAERKALNLYDRVRRRKSKSPSPALVNHASVTTSDSNSSPSPAHPSSPPALTPDLRPNPKVKMSFALVALLVYTVGVKCRGFNKKETYAPEHIFSLSERTANKVLKQSMLDLVKHNRTHLVRIYPNGTRLSSSNYEPHRYWSAGAQLVAINWQTFGQRFCFYLCIHMLISCVLIMSDLGYMINHSMFQRNGRAGYVLKPAALREPNKELLSKRTNHILEVTVCISFPFEYRVKQTN